MEEMDLRQLWSVIRKRIWWVIVITVMFAGLGGAASYFLMTPKYEADTTLLVNQKQGTQQGQVQYDVILANQALVKTYSDIIESKTVESAVIQQLGLSLNDQALNQMIQVTSPDQSQVIKIAVISPSDALSVNIANALATTFQSKAQSLMNLEDVEVVDPAMLSQHPVPVSPHKLLNIVIATLAGLLVSIGWVFLLEYFDAHLRTEEDVKRYLNLPVLGVIGENR